MKKVGVLVVPPWGRSARRSYRLGVKQSSSGTVEGGKHQTLLTTQRGQGCLSNDREVKYCARFYSKVTKHSQVDHILICQNSSKPKTTNRKNSTA